MPAAVTLNISNSWVRLVQQTNGEFYLWVIQAPCKHICCNHDPGNPCDELFHLNVPLAFALQ